jgi:hypothetical protein
MPNRFRPDPELVGSAPLLARRLQERGALLDGAWLRGTQATLPRELIQESFARCGAHEGTIWLLKESVLIPVVNTGPHAAALVDTFEQSIERGIIGMVAVTEQAFCENEIQADARRDATLDAKLGLQTLAMMAVPLVYAGCVRGVVSCVQLRDDRPAPGFQPVHLETLERDVSVAGRLINLILLDGVMGLNGA